MTTLNWIYGYPNVAASVSKTSPAIAPLLRNIGFTDIKLAQSKAGKVSFFGHYMATLPVGWRRKSIRRDDQGNRSVVLVYDDQDRERLMTKYGSYTKLFPYYKIIHKSLDPRVDPVLPHIVGPKGKKYFVTAAFPSLLNSYKEDLITLARLGFYPTGQYLDKLFYIMPNGWTSTRRNTYFQIYQPADPKMGKGFSINLHERLATALGSVIGDI